MIKKLAKSLVAWQIKNRYLSEKDSNLYTYAYELLIGQAVNLLIACLLAVVFNDYITVIVFLITFIPLRSYAGGHHADSFDVCTIVSSIIVCAVCIAAKITPLKAILFINIAVGIVSGGLLFKLAPMEDHNKPLSAAEKKQYRKYSILIWVIESILWMVCYYIKAINISFAVILGHLTLSVLLCAGLMKNKYLAKVN